MYLVTTQLISGLSYFLSGSGLYNGWWSPCGQREGERNGWRFAVSCRVFYKYTMRLMQTHAHIGHIYVFQLLNFSIKINVDFIKKKNSRKGSVLFSYILMDWILHSKQKVMHCLPWKLKIQIRKLPSIYNCLLGSSVVEDQIKGFGVICTWK